MPKNLSCSASPAVIGSASAPASGALRWGDHNPVMLFGSIRGLTSHTGSLIGLREALLIPSGARVDQNMDSVPVSVALVRPGHDWPDGVTVLSSVTG